MPAVLRAQSLSGQITLMSYAGIFQDNYTKTVIEPFQQAHPGVILGRGADNPYGDALEQVIAAPEGQSSYHHAVIDRLAQDGVTVAAVERAAGRWQEIDRPEDVAAWAAAHGGAGATA